MSSAADVEIWDNATQAFDKGSLQEAISLFQSMGTISSKISFNIGSVYLAQDNIQDALKVHVLITFGFLTLEGGKRVL